MQTKLNKILELCRTKSNDDIFYYFKYNPVLNHITIDKSDYSGNRLYFKDKLKTGSLGVYLNGDEGLDIVLSIMQNE